MLNPPYDTFIFDLDGTLLDTLPDLVRLTNGVLAEFGYPPRTTEEIHSYVGDGARALIAQAIPEGTPASDAERCIARWKEAYAAYPNDLTHPYDGIVATLEALRQRGCKLGVLSNKFHGGVTFIIDKCLPDVFDVAHGEGEGFPRKPDPTGLKRTIGELGSTPEKTVYIGDSPSDVATAKGAGCCAVGVGWGYHPLEDFHMADVQADLLVSEPRELVALAPEPR